MREAGKAHAQCACTATCSAVCALPVHQCALAVQLRAQLMYVHSSSAHALTPASCRSYTLADVMYGGSAGHILGVGIVLGLRATGKL